MRMGSQVYDEATYQSAAELSKANAGLRADMQERLKGLGLTEAQIETALTPLVQLHAGLDEEIAFYAGVRRQLAAVPLEDLGDVVPKLRKLQHWSQHRLATESGIGATTVKNREDNRYLKTPLRELVDALAILGYTATVSIRHTNGKDAS